MKLDISSLESTAQEMGDFLEKFRDYEASYDILFPSMLQTSVLKAFEFAYDEHKVREVLSITDDFLEGASFLLTELTRRNVP